MTGEGVALFSPNGKWLSRASCVLSSPALSWSYGNGRQRTVTEEERLTQETDAPPHTESHNGNLPSHSRVVYAPFLYTINPPTRSRNITPTNIHSIPMTTPFV